MVEFKMHTTLFISFTHHVLKACVNINLESIYASLIPIMFLYLVVRSLPFFNTYNLLWDIEESIKRPNNGIKRDPKIIKSGLHCWRNIFIEGFDGL